MNARNTKLTDEQNEIIETSKNMKKGNILQITACAGSGKTFTLAETARANPEKTFLYLAFNKAAATDAAKKFPKNVEVRTVHSAAYREMVSKGPYRGREIRNIRAYDIMQALCTKDYYIAKDALEKYTEYLHSDDKKPSKMAKKLYDMAEEGKIPLTHDHYLKAFQLKNLTERKFGRSYDFVMLDEAQDSNDVTMSLFLNGSCGKILVGDPNQQIYAFRGAVNIMEKVNPDTRLTLSTSFRCPKLVIDRCNAILKKYKPDSFMEMQATHEGLAAVNPSGKTAYLSRCNARLISCFSALSDAGNEKNIRFERDPDRIFTPALCVLDFLHGEKARSREMSFIDNFPDAEKLAEYAEKTNDVELSGAIALAKNLGNRLEPLYFAAQKCYRNQEREDRLISLSTAHSAKGLEWENIIILDDFIPLRETADDLSAGRITQQELNEEVNLYYVTCTRSIRNIVDGTANMDELLQLNAVSSDEYETNSELAEIYAEDGKIFRQNEKPSRRTGKKRRTA